MRFHTFVQALMLMCLASSAGYSQRNLPNPTQGPLQRVPINGNPAPILAPVPPRSTSPPVMVSQPGGVPSAGSQPTGNPVSSGSQPGGNIVQHQVGFGYLATQSQPSLVLTQTLQNVRYFSGIFSPQAPLTNPELARTTHLPGGWVPGGFYLYLWGPQGQIPSSGPTTQNPITNLVATGLVLRAKAPNGKVYQFNGTKAFTPRQDQMAVNLSLAQNLGSAAQFQTALRTNPGFNAAGNGYALTQPVANFFAQLDARNGLELATKMGQGMVKAQSMTPGENLGVALMGVFEAELDQCYCTSDSVLAGTGGRVEPDTTGAPAKLKVLVYFSWMVSDAGYQNADHNWFVTHIRPAPGFEGYQLLDNWTEAQPQN